MTQQKDGTLRLAKWIRAHTPGHPDLMTHLKLQKLAFYSYGGLLAFGLEDKVGDVLFQAWRHGPVSPTIYDQYKSYGRDPLPVPVPPFPFATDVETVLTEMLNVYGRLTAWQLREESHSEAPWMSSYQEGSNAPIEKEDMRNYFRAKFRAGRVSFPERLFGASSMLLDRIPVPAFRSLAEMSDAATRIFGAHPG